MIDLEQIRQINTPERIIVTEHARVRLVERHITIDDVINCINTGKIIEQYTNDKPFPSCLILGIAVHNKYIHVVISSDGEFIYLITAYYPSTEKFESDFATRDKKGVLNMKCFACGAKAEKGTTTSVTDLGNCLVIVRNVPCYKCTECNEIFYTGDVVQRLEKIIEMSKKIMQEISVIDYSKVA